MIRRCEPSHRRYSELCNRSGSAALQPAHSLMYKANALEDYWEDASVSLRSCHSWEAPSSAWLEASAPQPDAHNAEATSSGDLTAHYVRPCRYSFDASDWLGSTKGRRCFPPPLASCSTLSIKEGGRFVLKEMDADRPHGFFRAQRENGRLLLHLVLPDKADEDVVAAENDSNDEDDIGETDDDEEDGNSSMVVGCTTESRAAPSDRVVHVNYGERDEKCRRNPSDCSCSDIKRKSFDGSMEGVIVKECDCACQRCAHEHGVVDNVMSLCEGPEDVGPKTVEVTLSCSGQDVREEGGSWDLLKGGRYDSSDVGQLIPENRFGIEQGDVLCHQNQECIWNVDGASHAMANRSSWASNQMCLHQSLINLRPPLGLAMS